MRRLALVTGLALFAVSAAAVFEFSSVARTPPAPPVRPDAAVPPPRATPDPGAFVTPDASLELDRVFIAAFGDRPRGVVRGLAIPIDGAAIPTDPLLLPQSERSYRGGTHEGIDLPARYGTAVRAAAGGVVVRVDTGFTEWTWAEREAALAQAVRLGATPLDTLDRIRGRQVWIDHGGGIVTRYAHLSAVADGLAVGTAVAAGDVVGFVGSSGYPEGGPHLHFEVRVGGGYLGEGLTGAGLDAVLVRAFGPGVLAQTGASRAEGGLEDDLDGLRGDRPR